MAKYSGLVCPVRGPLTKPATVKGSLAPSEEARRIDAITFLLARGYPKKNIATEATVAKVGSKGTAMRADIAVFDVPADQVRKSNPVDVTAHALLLGEVKRDGADAKKALAHQVSPLLKFASKPDCLALYWDGINDRYFWRGVTNPLQQQGAGVASMPRWGQGTKAQPITYADIQPSENLVALFGAIEDMLHASYSTSLDKRYHLIFALLLAKLYDEGRHAGNPTEPLDIQDFAALGTSEAAARSVFSEVLGNAVGHYANHLPIPVPRELPEEFTTETLLSVLGLLAPIKITGSSQDVVQTFYMYFARHLYRYDMAQYWTPVLLTEFIVGMLNPRPMEHVRDPACGGADFLTSAFRRVGAASASCIWGADVSPESVQVAVLNMMLNGDGKSGIACEDSLLVLATAPAKYENRNDIMVCNPPFGTKIVERRQDVLKQYELGHEWAKDANGQWSKTNNVRENVEMGLLFAELCVREAKPGGRIGIILPNGYLNNTSTHYEALRYYLLSRCRITSIVSFPRYTFKASGADVSASVLFLEKRREPLADLRDDRNYKLHVAVTERVGWNVRNKTGEPIYACDPSDGTPIYENGKEKSSSDFPRICAEARNSDAARFFPWLTEGVVPTEYKPAAAGWTVSVAKILDEADISLDPKRLAGKYQSLVRAVEKRPHYSVGELVDFVDPVRRSAFVTTDSYRYAQLDDIGYGTVSPTTLKGWELPGRARRVPDAGDLFIGAVWGSVEKWFMAPVECSSLVVTSGCLQLRLKEGSVLLGDDGEVDVDSPIIDLVAGLNLEAYAVQMRAWARGSDGLASISSDDAAKVVIPRVEDLAIRASLRDFVQNLLLGSATLQDHVRHLVSTGGWKVPVPPTRYDHTVIL